VTDVTDDAVFVNTSKDRLSDMGWDQRPEEREGYRAEHAAGSSSSRTSSEFAGRTGASTTEYAGQAGGGRMSNTSGETVELREEELRARKEQVETGHVQIGKEVVEEQRTLEVPVTREEVTIDRRPVDRQPSDAPIGSDTETIRVPVREERVEVEKTPVVYEEVGVGKRQVTETQQVTDTVRREEARIGQTGGANASGVAGGAWESAMPRYRQQWQERYGSSGRWEDYEPSYRYGYELRSRPEYSNRSWTDVESDARSDWERRNPNTPWDRARDAIRDTWEDR
jgi:uncharacterized protein (TIGR02271 family)